jgi:hypothetical protein
MADHLRLQEFLQKSVLQQLAKNTTFSLTRPLER